MPEHSLHLAIPHTGTVISMGWAPWERNIFIPGVNDKRNDRNSKATGVGPSHLPCPLPFLACLQKQLSPPGHFPASLTASGEVFGLQWAAVTLGICSCIQ